MNIILDSCSGLKNVTIQNSPMQPEIIPRMILALSCKSITFNVEVKSRTEDKQLFFGEVIESELEHIEKCGLSIGDEITFTKENICYISQAG